MKKIIFIFLLLVPILGSAQLLDCSKQLWAEDPFFDAPTIKKYNIRSITGEIHYKRDYEKMHNKGLIVQYNFDEKGRLINQFSTYKKYGGILDTIMILYEYDSKDRLITKRKGDAFGFYSLNYEYNEKNHVIKETYCRDINETPWQYTFILSKQFPIGIEEFKYLYHGQNQYKINHLNNLGISYKEVIVNLDEKFRIKESSGRFVTTSKNDILNLSYDEKNRVTERKEFSNFNGDKTLVYYFNYNENGQIIDFEKWKNNIKSEYTEFIYDSSSPLFNARLSHDLENKIMDVVKYTYKYYSSY